MKKMFVFALAALSLAGQMNIAHAAGAGKDVRSPYAKARDLERAAHEAGKSGAGVHSANAADLGRQLDSARVGNLSAKQSRDIHDMLGDEAVASAVRDILASSNDASVADFNSARLEGLANIKGISRDMSTDTIAKMDPKVRAEQSFLTMVLNASAKAASWSGGETGARTIFTKILADANSQIRSGKSAGDALTEAVRSHLKAQNGKEPSQKDIEQFIDSIVKYCK